MKWFKHLTGSLKDSIIFEAIENFGGDAYLVFFGTLELMSDEFDIHNPGVVRLSIKKMTTFFQLSRQKTIKILTFFDQKAKEKPKETLSFLVTFEKDHVVINCRKLKDLCDEFTQKLLKKDRDSIGSESGFTPVQEEEIRDKKKEEDNKVNIYTPIFDFWNARKIVEHRKLTDKMKTAINRALKEFTTEEIQQAIQNYSEILHSPDYYFKYRWPLEDFLNRGLRKFVDSVDPRSNYRKNDAPADNRARPSENFHPLDREDFYAD